jgi:lysophospholipase L1-like esterase
MSRTKRALFWLITLILILSPVAIAEWILRAAGLGDPILYYVNPGYRYAQQPNQQKIRRHGAHVTIDSKGLRSTTDWSKPADAKILFVGDSVTWAGTYIDDKETFADGVCTRLAAATGKRFTCGIAAANQYGTDNMAARIRYRDFNDESVLVVTLISNDTVRGLSDAEGRFFFTKPPHGPLKAIWEATTYLMWRLYAELRISGGAYRGENEAAVATRSLGNLFSAIRDTERPGRKVLLVLSPARLELGEKESAFTKNVKAQLALSGYDLLDLHGPMSQSGIPGLYYDDIHLSVAGHRFYAERIAQALATHFRHAGESKPTIPSGR